MSRMIRIIVWIVVLAAVGAVTVHYWPTGPQTQQAQGQKRGPGGFGGPGGPGGGGGFRAGPNAGPVPVLVATARIADVPVYLDGVGTARALNTVTVRPQVDGKLLSVRFQEGQDVKAGDVIAQIDPVTYQAQLDQALGKKAQDEAQLANARLDLERLQKLAATNAIPKQQADTQQALVNQLQAQVKVDQAAIENAQAILDYTTIRAPIAGRTGIRQVDEGNLVSGSDTTGIVVITTVKPISVFFNLPQQQLPEVNKGMAIGQLKVDALTPDTGTVLDSGKLVVVDNQVDSTTGTVRLKAEFPNADLQLWPGQFVNVRLLINTLQQVVVIPTSAVQRGPNGTFVYVVQPDDTVAMRPVSLTQQGDVQTVVARGVEGGDRVVTSGFARLTDGTRVQATTTEDNDRQQQLQQQTPAGPQSQDNRRRPGAAKRQQRSGAVTGVPGVTPAEAATTSGAGAPRP